MAHIEKYGYTERVTYSRTEEVLDLPDLVAVQRDSYQWFLEEGIAEVFESISPIEDYAGSLVLEFLDYEIHEDEENYSVQESKERDLTYSCPMSAKVRLINIETGEVKEQEVFMGDYPKMTDHGTFIINGAERVIVNQLVRSPGVYYDREIDKSGRNQFSATVIPNRGAWIEYDTDAKGVVNVRIDRTRKLPATTLMRALIVDSTEEMVELFGESDALSRTLEKEVSTNQDEAMIEIYKKLRPGDPASLESAEPYILNLFFDGKRYDLAKVGRYRFNEKLCISSRIKGHLAGKDIIDLDTGEVLVESGEYISEEKAIEIENAGINSVDLRMEDEIARVVGNHFVSSEAFGLDFDYSHLKLSEKIYYPVMMDILEENDTAEEIYGAMKKRKNELSPHHIIRADILASFSYQLNLFQGIGQIDDIDHLGNRRVRGVGELLQNQYRIGITRVERVVRERMSTQDTDLATPQALINIRPVTAAMKEFFGSSQLSQFMDQTNPMGELTHKRRMSALGPGGLSRDRAGADVRDVHDSHYGRICPIETPEGPNIGLITSMTTYARINEYGFLETPYRKVDKENRQLTDEIHYLTATEEDRYIIAQANEPIKDGWFVNDRVSGRGINAENDLYPAKDVDYMDVSPQQIVSVGTAMIPFLENDDATRALMGANMQRQALPLLKTEAPIIGTGIEHKAAHDSGGVILSKVDGVVTNLSNDSITIEDKDGKEHVHGFFKFKRSNQGTTINHKPIVKKGDEVVEGQILCDGPSTDNGEMALGKNLKIAFMPWNGYNFEDAILLNEKLVIDDTLTSIHLSEYECEARETKLGSEEITRDIPNVGDDMRSDLDEDGIIRVGAEVTSGDILVGKVTPKGETELSPEERLLRAIFGEKAREVRDTSLKVPHGEGGIVIDVQTYSRERGDELPPGVNETVRVLIATKRKIKVGDKMCGRHGNKGVISRLLPEEDMPFLPDGSPVDMVLNPLGVPSRMNLGQVLEVHLGLAADTLGVKIATPVFDGASDDDIIEALQKANMPEDGKLSLRDGRTGEEFDNPVTVGVMYMLKLHHIVDEKIHARATGPYSLVTQQPLGGRAQFGGQRFGEMEVWALEAYGASYTLQEMLTIKSDDINGRVKTYESIVKGDTITEPGIPESFKVLIKELQAIALDIRLIDKDGEEVKLKETDDEILESDGLMK